MGWEFAEGNLSGSQGDLALLAELLSAMNACSRRAFALSLRHKTPPSEMDVDWGRASGVFSIHGRPSLELASAQENQVVRHASGLRKTSNAIAAHQAGKLAKIAEGLGRKIADLQGQILTLSGPPAPLEKAGARAKRLGKAKRAKEALLSLRKRQARLMASSGRQAELAGSGLASRTFGGSKALGQRHRIGEAGSPHAALDAWSQDWDMGRNGSWLFEGARNTSSANHLAKWDPEKNILSIRLTEDMAARRLAKAAKATGIPLEELSDAKIEKHGKHRVASEWIRLGLDFASKRGRTHQKAKIGQLTSALEPMALHEIDARNAKAFQEANARLAEKSKRLSEWQAAHPGEKPPKHLSTLPKPPKTPVPAREKYKGKTRPCKAPVSWRISLALSGGKLSAKARAQWEAEPAEAVSDRDAGCLGIDVNAWGCSWAAARADGSKPSPKMEKLLGRHFGDIPIAWAGASKTQATHMANMAAVELVGLALRWGCPIALEALDFEGRKASLRYESAGRARFLSGFAYRKLLSAIAARAGRMGVEVIRVDPSWTSVVGFAKYSTLGLGPDQAAAFAIARRGILSVKEANRERDMRRSKVGGEWILLASRREKLAGRKDLAGLLLASLLGPQPPAREGTASRSNDQSDLASSPGKLPGNHDACAPKASGEERSKPPAALGHERRLGMALGRDRRLWADRLRARPPAKAARADSAAGAQSPSPPKATGEGKARGGSSHPEASRSAEGPIGFSTDR